MATDLMSGFLYCRGHAWIFLHTVAGKIKRGGNVWIKIFPDKPVTKKPAETRMGSGKGGVEYYIAVIKPGKILYEMAGVDKAVATEALSLAAAKLNLKTKLITRQDDPWG